MKCSYSENDVKLLIKDLTGIVTPVSLEERAERVANGEFERSIMIKEYPISQQYYDIAMSFMEKYSGNTAIAVMSLAEQLYAAKGKGLVLVSIIRAGIPIGILIKRYLKYKYNIDVPHYAISLVKGLDYNAMHYILRNHPAERIQFIDGWTGKGTVTRELVESAKDYPGVDPSLAVLSDAIGVAKYCGIRRDFAIPSAPFNATATGLVSITIFNNVLVGPNDFHGAMYLSDLEQYDISNQFVDLIESKIKKESLPIYPYKEAVEVNEIDSISEKLDIAKKLLNPGINEAARAILRRDLAKLLVVDKKDAEVQSLIKLAEVKNVPVEEFTLKYYKAVTVARK